MFISSQVIGLLDENFQEALIDEVWRFTEIWGAYAIDLCHCMIGL